VKHLLTAGLAVVSIALLGGTAVAQSPSPGAGAPAELVGDETAPIVVWLDETRLPAIEAWQAAHPEQADLVSAEVVDIFQIPAKIALANNAGKGWPDVVFNGANLIAMTATPRNDWAMDLAPYVPQELLDQFEEHVIGECIRPDGRLICLSNDIAQSVTYFNKPLMDEFGYTVPTTWEELAALGEKVAVEHPGYLIGAFGDALSLDMYFWTARCATGQLKDEDTVYINVLAPECVRAAQWVDRMQALGVVAKVGTFDPLFIDAANKNQLLILTAPSWFGEFVFGGTPESVYYTEASGQLGVALPPKWEADDQPYFGGQGGAAWAVSRHTQNPKLAVDLVTWLSTANEYQVDLAPTYPAYKPPATEWVTRIAGNPLYANDPGPVYIEAAAYEDPLFGIVTYDTATIFATAVIGALNEGKSVESSLPAFQEALVQAAETAGYEVVTNP
jgi:multiple sugar transport system substrate-binding protein